MTTDSKERFGDRAGACAAPRPGYPGGATRIAFSTRTWAIWPSATSRYTVAAHTPTEGTIVGQRPACSAYPLSSGTMDQMGRGAGLSPLSPRRVHGGG
jgi:hypothetical protein